MGDLSDIIMSNSMLMTPNPMFPPGFGTVPPGLDIFRAHASHMDTPQCSILAQPMTKVLSEAEFEATAAIAAASIFQCSGGPVGCGGKFSKSCKETRQFFAAHRDAVVTMMLRGIPTTSTRTDVLTILDGAGFKGDYDFCYVPISFSAQVPIGYAIVNFRLPNVATRFQEVVKSGLVVFAQGGVDIVPMDREGHRGYAANIQRYRNSSVMHAAVPDEYKPAIFDYFGNRLPFPPPTKSVEAPTRVPKAIWRSWLRSVEGRGLAEPLKEPPCTMMVRKVPKEGERDMLVVAMDALGFSKTYNFVYLPISFVTQTAIGYAIVNFVSADAARRFAAAFDGFQAWPSGKESEPSTVVCVQNVSQRGLETNVERYRNSPVMHHVVPDKYKPAVFKDGHRCDFPSSDGEVLIPARVPEQVWHSWQAAAVEEVVTETVKADDDIENSLTFGGLDALDGDMKLCAEPIPQLAPILLWEPTKIQSDQIAQNALLELIAASAESKIKNTSKHSSVSNEPIRIAGMVH